MLERLTFQRKHYYYDECCVTGDGIYPMEGVYVCRWAVVLGYASDLQRVEVEGTVVRRIVLLQSFW